MKCSEVIEILECTSFTDAAFIDSNKTNDLNKHLSDCTECESKKDKIREFDLLLRARLKNVKVPLNLKSTVNENLRNYNIENELSIDNDKKNSFFGSYLNNNKILAMVASFILFIIIFVSVPNDSKNNIVSSPLGFSAIVADAISSHNKNLPMDIVCDENEKIANLEKWIDEKINFNISLENLKDYKIIGARECNLCDEKVAYLFLEKDGLKYSMFIVDSEEFDKISFDSQTSVVDNHDIKFWQNNKYGYFIVNNA